MLSVIISMKMQRKQCRRRLTGCWLQKQAEWQFIKIRWIPLSTFAGESTSSVGKNFIRSYAGVCLQGVVIALACIIFSAISSSPPAVNTGASVVTAVWTYVGELAFNLLVLVGAIKGCDRIVKEIMGL